MTWRTVLGLPLLLVSLGIFGCGSERQAVRANAMAEAGEAAPTVGWFKPSYLVQPLAPITATQSKLLRGVGPAVQSFHSIFGPYIATGNVTPGARPDGKQALTLTDGFAYLTGGWPILVSSTYIAVAEGTSIAAVVMHPESGPAYHRVFLLNPKCNSKLTVTLEQPYTGPQMAEMARNWQYVDVKVDANGNNFLGPIVTATGSPPVFSDPEAAAFITFLTTESEYFGFPF